MPAALESCVAHVMDKPDFVPQEGRTAEDSAYAICRSSMGLAVDGSEDTKQVGMDDAEIQRRAGNEMTRRGFTSTPTLRKKMPIAEAIGEFENGPQEGTLDLKLLRALVENQKRHPRQIPVYLGTGQPNPEHPQDLDERLADGWVEDFKLEGKRLIADVKLHGEAARAVIGDQVRGASIGTIAGKSYKGDPLGPVLAHVLLTNSPFIKGMNIAASRAKGTEQVVWHFSALKEAKMADPEKKPDPEKKADPDSLNLQEKVTALECLLQEKDGLIRELTASNENFKEEVEKYRESPQLEIAMKENTKLQRRVNAMRVRELVGLGLSRGQFNQVIVKGYEGGDKRSDEITLAWFNNSVFGGSEEKLEFALSTFPRTALNKQFASGAPGQGEEDAAYSLEEQKTIRAAGKDPAMLQKVRGARNFQDYKRLKAEAKGA